MLVDYNPTDEHCQAVPGGDVGQSRSANLKVGSSFGLVGIVFE